MTHVQHVLWELEMDYAGHPYYVSGNAILHALGQHLPAEQHQSLHASHGIFVPGEYGTYPEEHSQTGFKAYMGASLTEIETYDDLFLFRRPDHTWLLDSRPRDALNTHDIRVQSGQPALAHETIFGRPDEARKNKQTMKWYVHSYLHADDPETLPVGEDALDDLQFGGKRNYGYGMTRLKDTQVVDLTALDYSRLEGADNYLIEIVTPFVIESEYPDANDKAIPWWWNADSRSDVRLREERIVEQREQYELVTVDHGQVIGYEGSTAVRTAKSGIERVGSHSKYGFGEFRVIPVAEKA